MSIHHTLTTPSFCTLVAVASGWSTFPQNSHGFCSLATPMCSHPSSKLSAKHGSMKRQEDRTELCPLRHGWSLCVELLVRYWLEQAGAMLFMQTGFCKGRQAYRQSFWKLLGFEGEIDLPPMLPSPEEALCIFPAGRHVDVSRYLTWQTKAEQKKREVADATLEASPARRYKGRLIRTLD